LLDKWLRVKYASRRNAGLILQRNLTMRKSVFVGLALLLAGLTVLAQASSQTVSKDPPKKEPVVKETVIEVEDLDCEACATVIDVALKDIAEVGDVKMDIEQQTVTVTPKPQKTLSAKALWNAVEGTGFTPTKLVGPTGTFTKTPPS
jgi:copper chaperone CopZ